MKDAAVKYLSKKPLLHMDMLVPLWRGTAEILAAESGGVLLRETKSGAYMVSADSLRAGMALMAPTLARGPAAGHYFVAHQPFLRDYLSEKYRLICKLTCVQAVYLKKEPLPVRGDLEIRRLGAEHLEAVRRQYSNTLTDAKEYAGARVRAGAVYGGFLENTLCGYIGTHKEGSIGLLEVFAAYRGKGYGTALESFMVNRMLDRGLPPFSQVETGNRRSLRLQQKLGFEISEENVYWLY